MERSPFYASKFEGIDLSDVQTQEDFEKLPFSEKDDLRSAYPLGLQAVPDEEIVRIHKAQRHHGHAGHRSPHAAGRHRLGHPIRALLRDGGHHNRDRIRITLVTAVDGGHRLQRWAPSAWARWPSPWGRATSRSSCA